MQIISTEPIIGVYIGDRGKSFKRLIESVLNKGGFEQEHMKILLSEKNMNIFSEAFTSELIDERHNYQMYEQMGDLIGNQFIVWYFYRRFPQLKCAEGVKVVARLRINYGAKQSFYKIAESLGFWDFITATNDIRFRKKKDLLEDVFEAFLGATAWILDENFGQGVGYGKVYEILKNIFDGMDISLRYEDLYDAKTRLKELFDIHEDKLGPLTYRETKDDMITHSTVFRVAGGQYMEKPDGTVNKKRICGGRYIPIGKGSAALKSDAQQAAASVALKALAAQGWKKIPPKCYQKFMNPGEFEKPELTEEYIKKKYGNDINGLVKTKDKSKYQCKYMSTVLAMFCRKRNKVGVKLALKMGADPNIADTDGLFPLDLVYIGSYKPKRVRKIRKLLIAAGAKTEINESIAKTYCLKYDS